MNTKEMIQLMEKTIKEYQNIRDDLLKQSEEYADEADRMTVEIIKLKNSLEELKRKGL